MMRHGERERTGQILHRLGWPDGDRGCVLFAGPLNAGGRGQIWDRKTKKLLYAYRVSWIEKNGPIPAGLFVCHHCDNPGCINPNHLFLGTHADNAADMRAKGRGSNPPRHLGERNTNAKLTPAVVISIFHYLAPTRATAKRFNVSQNTVCCIRNGGTWSEVTGVHPRKRIRR